MAGVTPSVKGRLQYGRHSDPCTTRTNSVNEIKDLTGTTYPAANDLVSRMAGLGVIEEMTGQARNRRFRYTPYIRLFHDDPDGG